MSKKESANNIKMAFLLNLGFSIVELIGGIITNSISIISDSIHDFGDALSIAIAFFLEKKSKKEPNEKYTYGYLRYSILGALITTVVLLTGSIVMIYNSVYRIINPVEVNYNGMIILAVVGLIINGLGAYKTARGEHLNERTVSLHLLEDVLGWAVVLVGSILMRIFDMSILDPILCIGITIFILVHVFRNLKEIAQVFLEKAPENVNIKNIKSELISENVKDIHHIHVWTLDGVANYITLHVLLRDNITLDEIVETKKTIRNKLKEEGIEHATIEIEFCNEHCEEIDCKVCTHEGDGNHHHHHHHH